MIFIRGTTADLFRLDELDNLNGKEIVLNKAFKNHFFMETKKSKNNDTRNFRTWQNSRNGTGNVFTGKPMVLRQFKH